MVAELKGRAKCPHFPLHRGPSSWFVFRTLLPSGEAGFRVLGPQRWLRSGRGGEGRDPWLLSTGNTTTSHFRKILLKPTYNYW
jgi:hypothetical protein